MIRLFMENINYYYQKMTNFCLYRELNGDKIVVVCNFYNKEINLNFKEDFNNVEILLSNYKDSSILMKDLKLRPYEL